MCIHTHENWPRGSLTHFSTLTSRRAEFDFLWPLRSHFSCCLVTKLCPTLCDPMDCSPPGSSVHGISQARVLEWVAIFSSRGPSWLRAGTCVSYISCICRGFFTPEPRGKPLIFLGTLFYQFSLLSVVWPAFLCPPSHFHLLLFSFF